MTAEPSRAVTTRLVVTLGASAETAPELEWLAGMALRLRRELLALTVEDETSAQLASLPCNRLVSRSSGRALELDALAMRRALRVSTLRQRTRLELVARQLGLSLSLEESAGGTAPDLARLGRGDILTILHRGSDPLALPSWALVAGEAMAAIVRPGGRGLVLVYRDNPEALSVAEAVMQDERLPLHVVLLGDVQSGREPETPQAIEALRERWPRAVELEWRQRSDLEGLGARLSALRPRLLLLDRIANVVRAHARP